jgi:SET domain-containing protein
VLLQGGIYIPPAGVITDFRDGTQFVNHSFENFNVRNVHPLPNDIKELKACAIRDIKKGEEILENYNDYFE